MLERGKDGAWDQGGLIQGQGFENIGEKTFVYYGSWDPRPTGGTEVKRGGVGIASWPRDRIGELAFDPSGEGPGDYQMPRVTAELVTVAVSRPMEGFFMNVDGLGEDAVLRVEVLDALERPLAAFSGKKAALVNESGFQTPVVFASKEALPEKVRLRVFFEGVKRQEVRLSAVYVR